MPPKIVICSKKGASALLEFESERFDRVVSIGSPFEEKPKGLDKCPNVLRLEFDDVDEDIIGEHWVHPNENDITNLINFAQEDCNEILIHCHAGISRSTAAGFIMNSIFFGKGKEEGAIIVTARQCQELDIAPNRLMIKIADKLLDREGKMIQIVDDIFFSSVSNKMYG
jgi:predicted protein tyrosine phosphatase